MGSRNPDRIPLSHRRARCETIGKMLEENWEVVAHCAACGLLMRVDLAQLARLKGRGLSLWNRKARCRRLGCIGFVDFQARAPGMNGYEPLAAPWPGEM